MLRLNDTIARDPIRFYYAETVADCQRMYDHFIKRKMWALDTESTGLNVFRSEWRLRTFQFGNSRTSFVIPAEFDWYIHKIITYPRMFWVAHNGPHDIRSLDAFLGVRTGVVCNGETHIPSHHLDSRNRREGGIGHGLKDLAIALVDRDSGKWETALKAEFKNLTIEIPGEVYKSGPRKGQQKVRKARYSEGWALINPTNPAYIAYAASDPVLTARVWKKLKPTVDTFSKLYDRDHRLQQACDELTRRAMPLDVQYTRRLDAAYQTHAERMQAKATSFGCHNINSGMQIATTLVGLGAPLTALTPTGDPCTDNKILRKIMDSTKNPNVKEFIHCVLSAKQVMKRRASYTQHFLSEMDANGRVHPSINILGARTARMSVSNPPLQQLPTKDREDDI